jgi:hypothetical protein
MFRLDIAIFRIVYIHKVFALVYKLCDQMVSRYQTDNDTPQDI